MIRTLLLLLPVLLAACSREPAPLVGVPDTPETAECRREAWADPEMTLVFRRMPPQQASWMQRPEVRSTESRLIRACLERKGVLRPGVAPVVPAW
jgi:hypothetical protein